MNIRKGNTQYHIRSCALALFLLLSSFARAQNMEVYFRGLRSSKGQVMVKVFTDEKTFRDDTPLRVLKFSKQSMANGAMKATFDLSPGIYGLALLDDENNSGKMEYNFVGMPKEGFGFSNFYLTGLSKPHFDQFRFTVKDSKPMTIEMKLRYL